MSVLTSKLFWVDAIERSVRAMAWTALGLLTGDTVNLVSFDWRGFMLTTSVAGLVSVLASVAGSSSGNSASFVVDSKKKEN